MLVSVLTILCGSHFFSVIGVDCLPLPDSGPHLANDWGEPVRLRHLYAARHGLHLLLQQDGTVEGSVLQSSHSLVEIRAVDTGCVAIKGVESAQYLCMKRDGKLYGSTTYTRDDCSFVERIQPDGYSIYVSGKHGVLVSLSAGRNGSQGRDRGTAAQFLPMVSTLSLEAHDQPQGDQGPYTASQVYNDLGLEIDSMDPFGKVSQIVIQSPSFNKR